MSTWRRSLSPVFELKVERDGRKEEKEEEEEGEEDGIKRQNETILSICSAELATGKKYHLSAMQNSRIFSRVQRDSISHYVGRLVCWSVGRSRVCFFGGFKHFESF